jgi:hypothetical protein
MSTVFDVDAFLNEIVTEADQTDFTPLPVGEYQALIDRIEVKEGTANDNPARSWRSLNVFWKVDLAGSPIAELMGREEVTVIQTIFLDFDTQGRLAKGVNKNVGLGRLRKALGLNTPGAPFSFNMLQGRMGTITVTHRADKRTGQPQVQVQSVAAL